MKTVAATAFRSVLVGINTGSPRAWDESSFYLSDTVWPQSGNSSAFLFFRPRSTTGILATGRPRQKQDSGYGLFLTPVTSGATAAHGDTRLFRGTPKRELVFISSLTVRGRPETAGLTCGKVTKMGGAGRGPGAGRAGAARAL